MTKGVKLTKRSVDASIPSDRRYIVWDSKLKGFGLRVEVSGTKVYCVRYRPKNSGAQGQKCFITIGRHGTLTPEQARERAKAILGEVANGGDPAKTRSDFRDGMTIAEIGERFMADHIKIKRKKTTQALYGGLLTNHVYPRIGKRKAIDIKRDDISKIHLQLQNTPYIANRIIAVVSSLYTWAGKSGLIPEGLRPTANIELYKEVAKERYLTTQEFERFGQALIDAETVGIPWKSPVDKPSSKHLRKIENRKSLIDPYAVAAIKLLLLTGCRLQEILCLLWDNVDLDRGRIFLPDSKGGKRPVFLSAQTRSVLESLIPIGPYVIASPSKTKPRSDLKRPWASICRQADLKGFRIHDLRHTHGSIGAGGGFGLLILGKLLGHTQARTTAKYAHLADEPTMRAADAIGLTLDAALLGKLEKPSIDK